MPDIPRALAVGPGDGETIEGPAGGPLTFKARARQTGGSLTAFENVIAPGDGPPIHTHRDEDESWYVLSGHLRFRLGDDLHEAPQGTFVFVPRGAVHAFQNIGLGPARVLVLFTRPGWRGSSTRSRPRRRVDRTRACSRRWVARSAARAREDVGDLADTGQAERLSLPHGAPEALVGQLLGEVEQRPGDGGDRDALVPGEVARVEQSCAVNPQPGRRRGAE